MSDVRVTQVSDRFIDEFVYEGVESDLMGVSDARRMLHIFNSQGESRAILVNGKPVAFVGVFAVNECVGQIWGFFNTSIQKNLKSIMTALKGLLLMTVAENRFHRLQAVCKDGSDKAHNLITHFGFEKEGVLRAFGTNRENFVMYSRIIGGV
jgi:RimJ/RimL family protein N-acetyltransferase